MNNDIDWIELANHLAGRVPSDDGAALERWMGDDPRRQRIIEGLREVWEQSGAIRTPAGEVDVQAGWRTVERRLGASLRPGRMARGRAAIRRALPAVLRTAAAVLITAGAAAIVARGNHRPRAVAIREIRTDKGQRAEFRLDDGSRVVLGADSRLRWGTTLGSGPRDVYLEGQALFDVAHDVVRPFRVHAGAAVAEDIGTAFVVRAYADDPRVVVAVTQGVVALEHERHQRSSRTVLRAGDVGTLAADAPPTVRRDVDVQPYLAFSTGRLVFDHTPVPEALRELQRWYDVQVILTDSTLARETVSASFTDEGLSDIVAMLAASLDARVVWHGRTARLSPNP